jgi:hypothetical protein
MSDLAALQRYEEIKDQLNPLARFVLRISPAARRALLSISATVDDSPGWTSLHATPLDTPWPELYQQFTDALEAWRKNPLARQIVRLTSGYVVADGITLSSDYQPLQRFITRFWYHPLNNLPGRLPAWCDELTRSGELFPVLNRAADGMSYVRMVPASEIDGIQWLPGDYESETAYHRGGVTDPDGTWWTGPHAQNAPAATQLMLHYAINRPVGCTRGESDLAPILPWLRHYSRWLEDRVRINWASRVWLWFVRVPSNKIAAKQTQYARPPEPGSIIVHDEGEEWDMKSPAIAARDVASDGKAMRYMVASGAGVPLHMLSEAEGTNLATAEAQNDVTARHYRQRQQTFAQMLVDLTLHAYEHWRVHQARPPRACTYADLSVSLPEIVRSDNGALATAGREIVGMLSELRGQLSQAGIPLTDDLHRRTVDLAFRFAGEILDREEIDALLGAGANGAIPHTAPPEPQTPRPEETQP